MFPYIIDDPDSRRISKEKSTLNMNRPAAIVIEEDSPSPPNKRRDSSMYDYKSDAVKNIELIAKSRDERRQRLADEKAITISNTNNNNKDQHHPYNRATREFSQMVDEYRGKIEMHPLKENDETVSDNQIVVCVRKRPLNARELQRNEIDVITVTTKDQLIVHEPKHKVNLTRYLDNHPFRFDYVFNENCTNQSVYKYTAKPLIKTIFDGGMATCFAYGQTGSGKTHTMGGEFKGKSQNFRNGIYGLVASDIFEQLNKSTDTFQVTASFFEIYGRFAFDLLAKRKRLKVLEDGRQIVQVIELTEHPVGQVSDVFELIRKGSGERTSGQTSANTNSSRSHAIFQIVLRRTGNDDIHGKFSLIDLAGNERGADTTNSDRQTRKEGADINRSLLALKECIRALGRKGAHCPFRESILTQILRDSFIGDKSRTCMIAMISPIYSAVEHSLNTLRYADRVKELATTGGIDYDDDDTDVVDNLFEDANDLLMLVEDNSVDLIGAAEWDVLTNSKDVINSCLTFQQIATELFDNRNQKFGSDKLAFVRNWKNLLRDMIDLQRDAYVKAKRLCDLLEDH